MAESDRRVVFHFKSNQNRELPLLVGGLPVLPMKWWATRDFTKPLTEPPLGSGPYKVGHFELGRTVTYERDPNWWAKDMPTGRGLFNFDRVRDRIFPRPDRGASRRSRPGQIDWRQENISKQWATGYDFPAVSSGLVRKDEIPAAAADRHPGLDHEHAAPAIRRSAGARSARQVFDFQWMNKNLFYDVYTRTESYFGNTGAGVDRPAGRRGTRPAGAVQGPDPPAVFTQPFELPVTDGSGNNREGLRRRSTCSSKRAGRSRTASWSTRTGSR